jgi:hypothetical protein
MWIIPKNLPVSVFAQDMAASKSDSKELSQIFAQSFMWRGNVSRWQTWLQRLKRVCWIQHLSGRMLKPSMDALFVEKWTSLWVDIPVRDFQLQEKDSVQTTPDTFGRILLESSRQLDLPGVFLKTSKDISLLDSPKFYKAYEIWVTKLRREYSVRRSVVLLTGENDCLFWPTTRATDMGSAEKFVTKTKTGFANPRGGGVKLTDVIMNWPTPQARDSRGHSIKKDRIPDIVGLPDQVSLNTNGKNRESFLWKTPAAEEGFNRRKYKAGVRTDGLQTQVKGRLNPAWVEQLMGLPKGWTDCDFSETELSRSRRKRRSDV